MLTFLQRKKLMAGANTPYLDQVIDELKRENPNAFLMNVNDLKNRVFYIMPQNLHLDKYKRFIKYSQ
jgi:hypothetical protein